MNCSPTNMRPARQHGSTSRRPSTWSRASIPPRYDLYVRGRWRRHDGVVYSLALFRGGSGNGEQRCADEQPTTGLHSRQRRSQLSGTRQEASPYPEQLLVEKDGQPLLVGGTPGAHWQVQTNLQMLVNVLDFGMDPQAAIEAPRFIIGDQLSVGDPRSNSNHASASHDRRTTRLGHEIVVVGPWGSAGSVQLIARNPETGLLSGATEVRRAGTSVLGIIEKDNAALVGTSLRPVRGRPTVRSYSVRRTTLVHRSTGSAVTEKASWRGNPLSDRRALSAGATMFHARILANF